MKKALKLIVFLLGLCGLFSVLSAQPTQVTMQQLNKMPLAFTKNMGQWDEQVQYRTSSGGATIWICKDKVVYQFLRTVKDSSKTEALTSSPDDPMNRFSHKPDSIEQLTITAKFIGPNPNVEVIGEGEMAYKCNFFRGNNSAKWRTDVPNYESITLREVFNGTSIRFSGSDDGRLMYEYSILPGAPTNQVRFEYLGLENKPLDSLGKMTLKSRWGDITGVLAPPSANVERTWDDVSDLMIVNRRNTGVARSTKVLSPQAVVLVYSTFLGGSVQDWGSGISVDGSGSVYVTGHTWYLHSDFPTQNAYDATSNLDWDVFVTKFSPNGNSLIYSTYLGGLCWELGHSIDVDVSGCAYVVGRTCSSDFPTSSAYDVSYNGDDWDVFVTKFSPAGNSLVYSTFLGGASIEYASSISVDGVGCAFVTGTTGSANFPMQDPFDSVLDDLRDAFVTKLSSTGSSLVYSTYLGGSSNENGRGIAVDESGFAYVTGETNSTNFPTMNGWDVSANGGADAFVTKFSQAGNSIEFSTLLGGVSSDVSSGIALDGLNCPYVTGWTSSTDFPTHNGYDPSNNGGVDLFLAKLSAMGSSLVYSTYIGGSNDDYDPYGQSGGITVDASGCAHVVGTTKSLDFPVINAFDPTYNGGSLQLPYDVVVVKINASGNSLSYSTYLGGGFEEYGYAIAADLQGNSYVTGMTRSADFPTVSAYDASFNLSDDVFVTKIGQQSSTSTPIVPIVLVHGWTSTSGIWGDLTNRLKADGFGPVWPVQLVPCGTEEERLFDPGNPATVKYLFRGNASELSSQIRQRFNSMPADSQARVQEIDIIAHSMGGLVSRRYIQSYFPDDDWREERFRVRNLIMLGTPNKGSSFGGWWTASNLFGGCHWGDPAYEEIGEEYMKIFNAWFPDKVSETSYHAGAGSGGVGEAIITDCGAVYGCYNGAGVFLNDCDFGGNDGLVTVRSARTSPTGSYYPGVVRFLCHNQYYTDAILYTSFIKKVISGQPYSNDSEREGTEAPRIASICFQHTDSLANAISTSGNFLIDANDVAYIYASASSVEFEFRITSPASQIYDSLSTTIDSSVIALTGEDGIRGFVIQNADVGQWQWELVLPSIPIAPVYFGILASTHSSVSTTASQNLDYLVLGDSLILNITVMDGALPLTNLSILSTPIYNKSDTLAPIQFADDGLHSDGAANDGDYGLIISNLQDGIISLKTTIGGNASGGPVKRILSQSAYIQSFSCGDADASGFISISDAVFLINYIFGGGLAPNPIQAGDADCNSIVTISDAVFLINYIFTGGPAPCSGCL